MVMDTSAGAAAAPLKRERPNDDSWAESSSHDTSDEAARHGQLGAASAAGGRLLVGLQVDTCGAQHGDNMGTDEADVVLLGWVVVHQPKAPDMVPQVKAVHHSAVQPADLEKVDNESIAQCGVNATDLAGAPVLSHVLQQLDAFVAAACGDSGGCDFVLVTDGPLPIRQVLFPECYRKEITLADYFCSYVDLRSYFAPHDSLADALRAHELAVSEEPNQFVRRLRDLGTALCFAATQAHGKGDIFGNGPELEPVKVRYEQGVCRKDDVIDSATVVRARGLPWQASDQEVANFFLGLNIARGGIALCLSSLGRRNGEALVRFDSAHHRELALRRHRHFLHCRYLEIYRATGEEFVAVAAGNSKEVDDFLSRGGAGSVIVRMRGLPYTTSGEQILEFFESPDDAEKSCTVLCGENGILFVNRPDGTATGDAFVLFASDEAAERAVAKHKQRIGQRYIELFRSTTAEVQQVITKTMESGSLKAAKQAQQAAAQQQQFTAAAQNASAAAAAAQMAAGLAAGGLLPGLVAPNILSQPLVISGQKRDCIRLRGLPYEAQVQHILDFLGDFAKHIVLQGVHMVYNSQGHPSGEAFIQMDSEHAAQATAFDRHNKYMHIARKQRYIEVFQCSADDMNLSLGAQPLANGASPAGSGTSTCMPMGVSSPQGGIPQPRMPPTSMMNGGYAGSMAGGGGQHMLPAHSTPMGNNFAGMISPQLYATLSQQYGNGQLQSLLQQQQQQQQQQHAVQPRPMQFVPGMPMVSSAPMAGAGAQSGGLPYHMWPYPSPPVSPTNAAYFMALQQQQMLLAQQQASALLQQQQQLAAAAAAPGGMQPQHNGMNGCGGGAPVQQACYVLVRNLPPTAAPNDLCALFQGLAEVTSDGVQVQRSPQTGQPTGDALVVFASRLDAERAVLAKNHSVLAPGQRQLEMFLVAA